MEELLTPNEVANILRVTIGTVYDYLADGSLKSTRLGDKPQGPYRVKLSDLEEFVATRGSKIGNAEPRE